MRRTGVMTLCALALFCLAIGFKVLFKHTGSSGWQDAEEVTTQLAFVLVWADAIIFLIKYKKKSKQSDDDDANDTGDGSPS